MKTKNKIVLIAALSVVAGTFICCAQEYTSKDGESKVVGALTTGRPKYTRELVLGNILSGALENMHLAKKKIDDDLSQKAYKLFVERVDYGKMFLLKEDFNQLKKYEKALDDELKQGNLLLLDEAEELLSKRTKEVASFVMEYLKKPIEYNEPVKFETEPKKRQYAKNQKELQERWSLFLRHEIINKMIDQINEENGINDDKSKKKKVVKKLEKPSSMADVEKKSREKVAKSYQKIFKRLQEEKRNDKLDKFYNTITRVFDPHTHYLAPEEKEDFDIDMTGQLQGIGALLREDGSYIKVEKIIPGSASWKGKELQAEDTILAVAQGKEDPVDVVDMSLRDAVKMIRGPKGSEVRLTVKKPDGTTKIIPIKREVVVIEESYAKGSILENEKLGIKIGYIQLPKFYRDFNKQDGVNCSDDVKKELLRLKDAGVQGVILDLRHNGGGALEDARLISGLFIQKGPIVQVKSSMGSTEVLRDTDPKIQYKDPLVILVNHFSASASEIVAAAMQDYGRAVVVGVGEQTHGKGTVQAVVNLDDYVGPLKNDYSPLGALKITIQMFYRVTGGSTQFEGVKPDVVLPDPYEAIDQSERTMDYAIPYAKVDRVDFEKWDKFKYNPRLLSKNSKARVAKNERFKKIHEVVDWYKKRKDDTVRTLSLDEMKKEREISNAKAESLKGEDVIPDIKVTSFVKVIDEQTKESKEEFEKSLKTDPIIEETLYIFKDILATMAQEKV